MSDNLPAPSAPNWLADWLSNGKIPGAAKAIAQLIGSTANAGSAWINIATVKGQQIQQSIKNDTDASTVVSKALAKAAAKQGIEDAGLVERAVDQWAGARLKAQSNRETIASKTIHHLEEDAEQVISEYPPEEEWMDIYGSFAEKASKEKLQETWSRVLAGEIRKPGTFSYATLQMISTLDAHIASEFEHYATQVSDEHTIIEPARFSWTEDFPRIAFLKEFGIFASDAARKSALADAGYIIRVFGQMCLVIRGEPNTEIQFNVMSLTRSGREIFSIIQPKVEMLHLRSTAVAIANKSEVKSVQICKILGRKGKNYDLAVLDEITKSNPQAPA